MAKAQSKSTPLHTRGSPKRSPARGEGQYEAAERAVGQVPNADSPPTGDVDFLDGSSILHACGAISRFTGRDKVTPQYGAWRALIADVRHSEGLRPASKSVLAIAIDPDNESQHHFRVAVARHGYSVWPVNFRDVGMSPLPGQSDSMERPQQSLTVRIAFALGAQLRHRQACDVAIVTHDYQIWSAMDEFVRLSEESRVMLCYFRSLLERRWRYKIDAWQGQHPQRLIFTDLEHHASRIFGFEWPDESAAVRRSPGHDSSVI